MAKLIYKTRGMSNPKGKPRVYFTCHPQDFEIYFKPITDEVLQYQNCAIWYDEEPDAPYDEDFLGDLEGMQLFVIPVTSQFLFQECRARTVEFAFAMEHNIPVLPLMQEAGLESDFNRICGDLQFLDKNQKDNTAIPYEEKLQKFLSSVLVDDETAAKVRAAFDAYVFLSYRKKDRRFANELMRLIHQNEFCRDIAIWYDEYLVPGENFNDAIRDAMEKSRLFALLVTPNLVNENNYVMSVEYPAAQDAHKPVLPVEMENTDHRELKEKYEGIPDCISSKDGRQLTDALTEHLRDIAIAENDGDAQHLFFIGLAYLNGIDVEVDHERAVSLIQAAAEAELDPAVEKLVAMYRLGEGLKRDYREAIRLQRELTGIRRRKYEETGEVEDGHRFLAAQWDLADYLYEREQTDEAWQEYLTQAEQAGKMADRFGTVIAWACASAGFNALGEISTAKGDSASARTFIKKAVEIDEHLAEAVGGESPATRQFLAVSYGRLGRNYLEAGEVSEASVYYEKSRDICQQLADKIGGEDERVDLSIAYSRLGEVRNWSGDSSGAESCFQESLEIAKKLSREAWTPQVRSRLAAAYQTMGIFQRSREQFREAEECFQKSVGILKKLADDIKTPKAYRELTAAYRSLGQFFQKRGKTDEAGDQFQKALQVAVRRAQETGAQDAYRMVVTILEEQSKLARESGDREAFRDTCRSQFMLVSSLADADRTVDNFRALADVCDNLAECDAVFEDWKEAEAHYQKSLEIRDWIAKQEDTVRARYELSYTYVMFGKYTEMRGQLSRAKDSYRKACQIREALAEEMQEQRYLQALTVCYDGLGSICWKMRDMAGAEKYLQKSLKVRERIAGETGEDEAQCALYASYVTMGNFCKEQGKLLEAEDFYKKALEISERIADKTKGYDDYNSVAAVYYKLGLLDEGNLNRECLLKAGSIWKQLAEAVPDNEHYQRMVISVVRALDDEREENSGFFKRLRRKLGGKKHSQGEDE